MVIRIKKAKIQYIVRFGAGDMKKKFFPEILYLCLLIPEQQNSIIKIPSFYEKVDFPFGYYIIYRWL